MRSSSADYGRRSGVEYHWTLVGDEQGAGRNREQRSDQLLLGADGLIAESQGHYDQVEYDPQLAGD
jgi:hypothetical protein